MFLGGGVLREANLPIRCTVIGREYIYTIFYKLILVHEKKCKFTVLFLEHRRDQRKIFSSFLKLKYSVSVRVGFFLIGGFCKQKIRAIYRCFTGKWGPKWGTRVTFVYNI